MRRRRKRVGVRTIDKFLFLPFFFLGCAGGAEPTVAPNSCSSFVGLDVKGVQSVNFPSGVLSIALAGVPCSAISFPWATFGDDNTELLEYLNQSVGETFLLISLFNATCVRNNNCAEGDLFQGMTPNRLNVYIEAQQDFVLFPLRARLKEIAQFLSLLPANVTPAISLALEDEFTADAAEIVAALIREELPGVKIVSNPLAGVRLAEYTDHDEVHGLMTRCDGAADIISQDGAIADDANDRALLTGDSGCFARFLWRPEWQGRARSGETLLPASAAPRDRQISFTREVAQEVNAKLRAAK